VISMSERDELERTEERLEQIPNANNEAKETPKEIASEEEASKPTVEIIKELLKEYASENPDVKLIVVTDESGLVVGAYPMSENQLEIVESIGGISSEVYKCVFEALEKKAPNIAGRVVGIVVGLKRYKIEFYRHMDYTLIVFRSIEVE